MDKVKILEIKMAEPHVALLVDSNDKVNKLMQQHQPMIKPNNHLQICFIKPMHFLVLWYQIPKIEPMTNFLSRLFQLSGRVLNILLEPLSCLSEKDFGLTLHWEYLHQLFFEDASFLRD